MRTVATFDSKSFELSDSETEQPLGADVANWLRSRLQAQGIQAEEPVPEDFGWYVTFSTTHGCYQAIIGPVGDEFWYVVIERVVGLLPSFLGLRHKHKEQSGVEAVQAALDDPHVAQRVRWHHWKAFRRAGADAFNHGTVQPA
jgi:hypothetical protein